jgi:hypothetical protein
MLVNVSVRPALIYKPIVAGLAGACALVVLWSTVGLDSLGLRVVACVSGLAVYGLTLVRLRIDPKDRQLLRPFAQK